MGSGATLTTWNHCITLSDGSQPPSCSATICFYDPASSSYFESNSYLPRDSGSLEGTCWPRAVYNSVPIRTTASQPAPHINVVAVLYDGGMRGFAVIKFKVLQTNRETITQPLLSPSGDASIGTFSCDVDLSDVHVQQDERPQPLHGSTSLSVLSGYGSESRWSESGWRYRPTQPPPQRVYDMVEPGSPTPYDLYGGGSRYGPSQPAHAEAASGYNLLYEWPPSRPTYAPPPPDRYAAPQPQPTYDQYYQPPLPPLPTLPPLPPLPTLPTQSTQPTQPTQPTYAQYYQLQQPPPPPQPQPPPQPSYYWQVQEAYPAQQQLYAYYPASRRRKGVDASRDSLLCVIS